MDWGSTFPARERAPSSPSPLFWQWGVGSFLVVRLQGHPKTPFQPCIGTSTKPALALHPPTASMVEDGGWPGTRMKTGLKSPQKSQRGIYRPQWTDLAMDFPHVFLRHPGKLGKKLVWDEIFRDWSFSRNILDRFWISFQARFEAWRNPTRVCIPSHAINLLKNMVGRKQPAR